jgi:hypothetical protein
MRRHYGGGRVPHYIILALEQLVAIRDGLTGAGCSKKTEQYAAASA